MEQPVGENFFAQVADILTNTGRVLLFQVDGEQADFLLDSPLSPPADYELVEPDPEGPEITNQKWRYLLMRQRAASFEDVTREARALQSAKDVNTQDALKRVAPKVDPTFLESAERDSDSSMLEEGADHDGT
jgi:hypothetical protein